MTLITPVAGLKASSLKIGWIGCGVMGLSMCHNCLQYGDCQTFLYSRTRSKCESLIRQGAIWCSSPADIISHNVDVVVSMTGYPKDTEEIVFGQDGIIKGINTMQHLINEGKIQGGRVPIFVDMSTGKPCLAIRIADAMQNLGSDSLDAPVSGGDVGAREQRLSIFVGGTVETFTKLEKSLFRFMADISKGGRIQRMGGPGAGQQTKMVNQILIATNMIGVCEALLYAQKAGLDIPTFLEAVSGGAAGSWSLSNLAPRLIRRDFTPGFFVNHFIKDMEIALDEARRLDLSLPGLALAHQLYVGLKAQGYGSCGTQGLLLVLEQLNGLQQKL